MSASIEASSTVRRCFEGAFEESRLLESGFRRASDDRGCAFLDAGLFASGSDADGVHFDREAHAALEKAVSQGRDAGVALAPPSRQQLSMGGAGLAVRAPGPVPEWEDGSMRPASILAGLFFVALTLRPQIVGIGPLLPAIQEDLHTTHTVVGLLGTIPVLCMGLFAPPAAFLGARVGTRLAIMWSLLLIGVFGLGRAVVPSAALVVLLTWPVGAGMGLAGALVPVAVKEHFPVRPAGPTGIYTTGIQVGSAVSAAIAVPLAAWYGGWRASLAVFSLLTLALTVVWLVLTRRDPTHERLEGRPPRLPWRSRPAWLLVALFALMASTYYGVNAWLPDSYVERDWSTTAAGNLLAVLNLVARMRPAPRSSP